MEFNKPESLKLSGNIAENFKLFKDEVTIFFEATETILKSQATQVARLLNLIGTDGLKLYRSIKRPKDEKETVETILKYLENYCIPRCNEIMEHFKFFTRKQLCEEKFDKYYAELRVLVKTCNFGEIEDRLLRTQIVLGIANKELQTRMLREELTLEKTIQLCQAVEQAELNSKLLEDQTKEIDVMEQYKKRTRDQGDEQKQDRRQIQTHNNGKTDQDKVFNCNKCGKQHKFRECPAYGKECRICKKLNHFAYKCKNKRQVDIVECESDNMSIEYLALDEIGNKDNNNMWFEKVKINDINIEVKIDTGAQLNVMSNKFYKTLKTEIKSSKVIIKVFGGTIIKSLGKVQVAVVGQSAKIITIFEVVEYDGNPILGYKDCKRLNYISELNEIKEEVSTENFIKKHLDVFTGIGCFPDKVKIKVKHGSVPIINSPRRVPIKLMEKLKELLKKLCYKKIIEKSKEPSEWQNSLVVIEKPDKSLRMCLDPRDLNKNIVREMVEIPTLDEVRNKLMNKKLYTLVDLKDGFYQCELEEGSKRYCAFSTPYGTYNFNRLPFGIACAPELFQQLTNKYFGDIQNVCVYIDDILVYGKTKEEHDEALKKVMDRARLLNIKFNPDKIQYQKNEIKYLGLKFSEKGVEPDEDRIKAILELKSPTNLKELQSVLGMVNYLRAFIPNMADIVEPMRVLLKKDSTWLWSDNCERSFNTLKNILSKIPILANYDAKDEFRIQCDASQKAIGCCLFQKDKPVYYASKCLSITEQGYAQIEKEMLAIKFSCIKFHRLIYGQEVITVQTDHQPLIPIMNKELNKIPNNRIKRMRVNLMIYNLKVEYCPGKYLYVADLLSRNYKQKIEKTDDTLKDIVHTMEVVNVKFENNKEGEFKKAILEDNTLKLVEQYLREGWPKKINSLGDIRHYHKIRNELMLEKGLIYYGCRLVVPRVMCKYIIKKLHETHLGISKTLKKSKQIFFWPGMASDITNAISICETCIKFSSEKIKEPLKQHERPSVPFQKVGLDIAEIFGNNYLIIIDYYSRWLEVLKLKDKSSQSVIELLKGVFSRFGIPKQVVADNNPCGSQEFKTFATQWLFEVILSSPYYAKSNGMAEKAVGIAKGMITKARYEKKDLNLFLLNYRNSPVAGLEYSPAQLLMARELRTLSNFLNPNIFKPKLVNCAGEMKKQEDYQKYWYDKTAGPEEKLFTEGEKVYIYDKFKKEWDEGEIIKKTKWPRSYYVKNAKGKVLRRNNSYIKKKFKIKDNSIINDDFMNIDEKEDDDSKKDNNKDDSIESKGSGSQILITGNNNKKQLEVSKKKEVTGSVITRAGRQIKKPNKLNL